MSGLILCRTKEAANPYYISNMDVKIYSLEELCYYIYNNIYLIGMDLVDSKLIDFVRNEVQEEKLAARLEYLVEKKAGLAEIVITILKYVDFYTTEEIEQIRGILATLNTQNVYERLKARADRFMVNECYYAAIRNYAQIINGKKDPTLSVVFYSDVCHNMGVAYARLFLFKQAQACFEEAYALSHHEDCRKCAMAAERLAINSQNINHVEFLDEQTEEEYVLSREIETLMDNAMYSDEYRYLDELQKSKENGNVSLYYKDINDILEKWKGQYGKYTG
ncbi:MAG: hypothetical protein PUE71_05445 [Clostridia bacterium]|nr:hypothetical protein [Clostridia bacterium]